MPKLNEQELKALADKHGLDEITPRSIILLAWDLARAIDHGITINAPHKGHPDWSCSISDQPMGEAAGIADDDEDEISIADIYDAVGISMLEPDDDEITFESLQFSALNDLTWPPYGMPLIDEQRIREWLVGR